MSRGVNSFMLPLLLLLLLLHAAEATVKQAALSLYKAVGDAVRGRQRRGGCARPKDKDGAFLRF